jgi:predicted metal-dependent HD superfamily phosphohydrolase
LTALFHLLTTHAPQVQPGSAARLAVWWHDAVYDAIYSDNEERSAELAHENLSRLNADATLAEDVIRRIHVTKNHWNGPPAGEGDYFLDADTVVLGARPNIYNQYMIDVRQEYAWAPYPAVRAGCSVFLIGALARSRLFRTDVFEAAYAAQAHENM